MAVALMFEHEDSITYEVLRANTQLQDDYLTRALQALVEGKVGLALNRSPEPFPMWKLISVVVPPPRLQFNRCLRRGFLPPRFFSMTEALPERIGRLPTAAVGPRVVRALEAAPARGWQCSIRKHCSH